MTDAERIKGKMFHDDMLAVRPEKWIKIAFSLFNNIFIVSVS